MSYPCAWRCIHCQTDQGGSGPATDLDHLRRPGDRGVVRSMGPGCRSSGCNACTNGVSDIPHREVSRHPWPKPAAGHLGRGRLPPGRPLGRGRAPDPPLLNPASPGPRQVTSSPRHDPGFGSRTPVQLFKASSNLPIFSIARPEAIIPPTQLRARSGPRSSVAIASVNLASFSRFLATPTTASMFSGFSSRARCQRTNAVSGVPTPSSCAGGSDETRVRGGECIATGCHGRSLL